MYRYLRLQVSGEACPPICLHFFSFAFHSMDWKRKKETGRRGNEEARRMLRICLRVEEEAGMQLVRGQPQVSEVLGFPEDPEICDFIDM